MKVQITCTYLLNITFSAYYNHLKLVIKHFVEKSLILHNFIIAMKITVHN